MKQLKELLKTAREAKEIYVSVNMEYYHFYARISKKELYFLMQNEDFVACISGLYKLRNGSLCIN